MTSGRLHVIVHEENGGHSRLLHLSAAVPLKKFLLAQRMAVLRVRTALKHLAHVHVAHNFPEDSKKMPVACALTAALLPQKHLSG